MSKFFKYFAVSFLGLFLTSCTTQSSGYRFETAPATLILDKKVSIVDKLDSPIKYVPIGKVHVHNRCNFWLLLFCPSEKSLKKILKKEALDLGANTIIRIRKIKMGQFEWSEKHMLGTAVYIAK
ncbi:MAG: hypothetical protein WCS27_11540 [Victivallaceae bacterium]